MSLSVNAGSWAFPFLTAVMNCCCVEVSLIPKSPDFLPKFVHLFPPLY